MSQGIGRLERYVLTRTLAGVAGALAVIGAVILLIDFVEVSRTVGGRGRSHGILQVGCSRGFDGSELLASLPKV